MEGNSQSCCPSSSVPALYNRTVPGSRLSQQVLSFQMAGPLVSGFLHLIPLEN